MDDHQERVEARAKMILRVLAHLFPVHPAPRRMMVDEALPLSSLVHGSPGSLDAERRQAREVCEQLLRAGVLVGHGVDASTLIVVLGPATAAALREPGPAREGTLYDEISDAMAGEGSGSPPIFDEVVELVLAAGCATVLTDEGRSTG